MKRVIRASAPVKYTGSISKQAESVADSIDSLMNMITQIPDLSQYLGNDDFKAVQQASDALHDFAHVYSYEENK